MKDEYDFRKGTRSKFYRPGASIQTPVYLEPDGVGVDKIVNELLKRDIAIIETIG